MKISSMIRVALCATLLAAAKTSAQTTDPLGKWFTSRGISVRKIFDGTKDEQSPASIFFVREPTGKDREFTSVDIAAKIKEYEWNPGTLGSILLYPVIDYHRSTNSAKRVNKAGGSARIEYRVAGLALPASGDTTKLPKLPGHYWPMVPTFIVDAKLGRDWASMTSETKYSVQMFPTGLYRGMPGSDFRKKDGSFVGRYYPYAGLEHHKFGPTAADTSFNVGFVRMWMELWPISTPTLQFMQLTVDATSRHRLGESSQMRKQLSDVALGANFFLDGNGHVGIGVEYANGRDATQRFARREKTTIGLRVKF